MTESSGLRPPPKIGARLVDQELFRFLANLEVVKALRVRYSVAMVCFTTHDTQVGVAPPPPLANIVSSRMRATDAVAPWQQSCWALLFTDAEITNLPSIVRRLTSDLDEVDWSAGGASYPQTAASADDMMRQATELMSRARVDKHSRLYLPA
jgi:hypothetical protein